MRVKARILAVLAAAACGGGDSKPDAHYDPPGNAEIELGTGTNAFEPMEEMSEQILVAGPQGGHHFIVNARMSGLLPGDPEQPGLVENPSTLFSVWNEAGERLDVDAAPYRLGYEIVDGTEDLYQLPGGRICQVEESRVEEIQAAPRVRIRVEITDSVEDHAEDERWVVPIEDPALGL